MTVWRMYLVGMELVLLVCAVVAAILDGGAALGPVAGLLIWTSLIAIIWPDTR